MHITIDAGPGSGKTTTLINGFLYQLTGNYNFIPTQEQINACYHFRHNFQSITASQTVFIAFNDSTKQILTQRLPTNCKAYTFNGLGQSVIFKKKGHGVLDNDRGQKLLEQVIGSRLKDIPYKDRIEYVSLLKYIDCCKTELYEPSVDNFYRIQEKYGMQTVPQNIELAKTLHHLMAHYNQTFDWNDQIWLGLQCLNKPLYKLAYIDEAQDLSPLRLEFALRVAENCIFCGDPFQSINAFAGADHEAFDKLMKISTIKLPLKTCFRMPPNHIEHANTIRPARITAFKTEIGPIDVINLDQLASTISTLKTVPKGYTLNNPQSTPSYSITKETLFNVPESASDLNNYLMVARTNATLFRIGIYLLKNRIPAKILRRKEDADIEKMLIRYLKSITNPYNCTVPKVTSIIALQNHLKADMNKANNMPFKQGSALYEQASCLMYLSNEASTPQEIPGLIQALVADRSNAVRLATGHKAKGLEAPFVFILFPPIPNPRAETPTEIAQEVNLQFVTETRSEYYKCYVKE